MGDTLKVKNVGDEDFVRSYERQTYEIPKGEVKFVPEEAAAHWFGNPNLVDVPPRARDRSEAYARLRVYYGAYDDDDLWERNKPKVEVYDLDDNRVTTIIDDPEGKHLTPAKQTVSDVEVLRQQLERQQAEIEKLRAEYQARQQKVDVGPSELPADTPENAPPVRGRRPEDGPTGNLRPRK